jgi:hypothetical protein
VLDHEGLHGTRPAHACITATARPAPRKLVAADKTRETTTDPVNV